MCKGQVKGHAHLQACCRRQMVPLVTALLNLPQHQNHLDSYEKADTGSVGWAGPELCLSPPSGRGPQESTGSLPLPLPQEARQPAAPGGVLMVSCIGCGGWRRRVLGMLPASGTAPAHPTEPEPLPLAASPAWLFMQPVSANLIHPDGIRESRSLYRGQAAGLQPCARRAFPAASWAWGFRSLQGSSERVRRGWRAEGDPVWTGVAVQRGRGLSPRQTPAMGNRRLCTRGFPFYLTRLPKPVLSLCQDWGRGETNKQITLILVKVGGRAQDKLRVFCFPYKPHEMAL